MHDDQITVPTSVSRHTLKFDSNNAEDPIIHHPDPAREGDAAFLKFTKKSWMKPKGNRERSRVYLATLLASSDASINCCIDKLLDENISYSDLGSLTKTDLELVGIKDHNDQKELLSFVQLLPNQDPSYYSVINLPEAQNYNSMIFNNATKHLEAMQSALSVADYKLKVMPADDVIVGEKNFASRFLLEALSELQGVTDEIDAQFLEFDELIKVNKHKPLGKNEVKRFSIALWILMGSIATGTLAAMWFLKFSK